MTAITSYGKGAYAPIRKARAAVIAILSAAAMAIASLVTTPQEAQAAHSPSPKACAIYAPLLYEDVDRQAGCVVALQIWLDNYVYGNMMIDGIFGSQTKWALVLYQQRLGWNTTGIAGSAFWAKVRSVCEPSGAPRVCYRTAYY